MIKKHRIYHFLIQQPYKSIFQKTITTSCNVTSEYVSKTLKKLREKGVIIKEKKNTIKLINPLMLIFLLNFEEKKQKPILFKISSLKDIKPLLNRTIYSITGESAINIKNGKKPKKIELFILGKDLQLLEDNLQKVKKNPNLKVYVKDHFSFLNLKYKEDIAITTDNEIILQLLNNGELKKAIFFFKTLF